jgi:hypothetical protein
MSSLSLITVLSIDAEYCEEDVESILGILDEDLSVITSKSYHSEFYNIIGNSFR